MNRSLAQAVITGLALIGVLTAGWFSGRSAFAAIVAIVVLLALYEALDGLNLAGRSSSRLLGLLGGLGLLAAMRFEREELVGAALMGTMSLALLWALRPGRGESPIEDAGWTVLSVAWVGGGGAAAMGILMLGNGGRSLLVGFVAIAALNDIGAYFIGTALGKHKMAPTISPAKSWEGFAAGVVTSLIAGMAVGAIVDELTVVQGFGLGAICGPLVPAGDLVESMFKRGLGVKDSGRLLPGHGGFLDRVDAIVFTAPAAWLYLWNIIY